MAFSTRYIDEYQAEIRLDLSDGSTLWSNNELNRSVQRAVDDLTRNYPRELVYEKTIIQTVTEETWTAAAAAGTYTDLTYKPIFPGSETVTDSSSNACTRDTDYTIDYINGRITFIDGGEIDAEEADCVISYTKEKIGVDISAIITNLVRVTRVEYPADRVPQQFVNFHIWDDFMFVGSQKPGESQTYMNDKEHIRIYYEMPHSAPGAASAPTYPAFLDEVVCIGAGAYALFTKAIQYEHQAVTDLTAMNTELGLTTAVHALADAAFDKVPLYLETNGTTDCSKDVLANITDDAAELRTAIETALDATTYVINNSTPPAAFKYLCDGDDHINTVGLGANVPQNYADYARASMEMYDRLLNEANIRLDNIRSYIEEAAGWDRVAEDFIAEGQARVAEINSHLEEARQWMEKANSDLALSDRFRAEGERRMSRFERLLEDRAEFRKRISSTPVTQPIVAGGSGTTSRPRTDRL